MFFRFPLLEVKDYPVKYRQTGRQTCLLKVKSILVVKGGTSLKGHETKESGYEVADHLNLLTYSVWLDGYTCKVVVNRSDYQNGFLVIDVMTETLGWLSVHPFDEKFLMKDLVVRE